jgi:hypothetical protein
MDSTLFVSVSSCTPSWMWIVLGMISIKVALWKRKAQKLNKNSLTRDSGVVKEKVHVSYNHLRRPYQRQMSSLGRFSLQSETPENPSLMTFFLLLGHNKKNDVKLEELNDLLQRQMLDRYERFNARICPKDGTTFEVRKETCQRKFIILNHKEHGVDSLSLILDYGPNCGSV